MNLDPLAALCAEYAAWNKSNGLNLGSADEHHFDEYLTEEQREWVRDFSARWEEAETALGESNNAQL